MTIGSHAISSAIRLLGRCSSPPASCPTELTRDSPIKSARPSLLTNWTLPRVMRTLPSCWLPMRIWLFRLCWIFVTSRATSALLPDLHSWGTVGHPKNKLNSKICLSICCKKSSPDIKMNNTRTLMIFTVKSKSYLNLTTVVALKYIKKLIWPAKIFLFAKSSRHIKQTTIPTSLTIRLRAFVTGNPVCLRNATFTRKTKTPTSARFLTS